MSVFLRWGVFGILGVAALLYAYNASKRLAEAHASDAAAAVKTPAADAAVEDTDEPDEPDEPPAAAESVSASPQVEPQREVIPHCEAELVVAQRAIDMRKEGAPLDRVLRIQEIAWQETPERRERLASVATRWFNYSGEFSPEALRITVINACQQATPAS
jgi:hypothetical protein